MRAPRELPFDRGTRPFALLQISYGDLADPDEVFKKVDDRIYLVDTTRARWARHRRSQSERHKVVAPGWDLHLYNSYLSRGGELNFNFALDSLTYETDGEGRGYWFYDEDMDLVGPEGLRRFARYTIKPRVFTGVFAPRTGDVRQTIHWSYGAPQKKMPSKTRDLLLHLLDVYLRRPAEGAYAVTL